MIRVILPAHLRTLARVNDEVEVETTCDLVTPRAIVEAVEQRYPMLCGTILDYERRKRRPLVRFFACGEDISHGALDTPLPESIACGAEPFLIVGAIAGG